MKNIKKTLIRYPYLEKPVEIYERECGHKIVFAYKRGSLINISSWVKTGSINENDDLARFLPFGNPNELMLSTALSIISGEQNPTQSSQLRTTVQHNSISRKASHAVEINR